MRLMEEAGYNVTGIDLSPAMLDIARTRVKGTLVQMDMRVITLPGAYDAVLCHFGTVGRRFGAGGGL